MDIGAFAASLGLAVLAYAAFGFLVKPKRQNQRVHVRRADDFAQRRSSGTAPVVASIFYEEFRLWAQTHPAELADEYIAFLKDSGHGLGTVPQEFVAETQTRIASDPAFHATVIEDMLVALREVERADPQRFDSVMQLLMQRATAGGHEKARLLNA